MTIATKKKLVFGLGIATGTVIAVFCSLIIYTTGYAAGKRKMKKESVQKKKEESDQNDLESGTIVNYAETAKKYYDGAGSYMSDPSIFGWDQDLSLGADGVTRDYPPEEPKNAEKDDIYRIQEEDFLEGNGYDKITYLYFNEDDTLLDETEEVVPNRTSLLGLVLQEFLSDDTLDILYVRNDGLGCDFEINRYFGKASEYLNL